MDKNKRTLKGIVESAAMDKTLVVSVEMIKQHTKYRKKYKTRKHYKVHDEENKYKVGDAVVFEEARPISRDKRWRVVDQK